jgi:hypothetical protein
LEQCAVVCGQEAHCRAYLLDAQASEWALLLTVAQMLSLRPLRGCSAGENRLRRRFGEARVISEQLSASSSSMDDDLVDLEGEQSGEGATSRPSTVRHAVAPSSSSQQQHQVVVPMKFGPGALSAPDVFFAAAPPATARVSSDVAPRSGGQRWRF